MPFLWPTDLSFFPAFMVDIKRLPQVFLKLNIRRRRLRVMTADGGGRTKDRGQRTEDRGRRTKGRGRRTEGGGRRAEGGKNSAAPGRAQADKTSFLLQERAWSLLS